MVQPPLLAALLAMIYAPHCAGAAPSLSVSYPPPGASAMTADAQGNIYLTGTTTGSLPATQGAAQPQYPGALCPQPAFFGPPPPPIPCTAAFALKLQASTGTVVWATYLGGYTNDGGTGIAVDPEGNVYVAGYTNGHFPTTAGSYMPGSSGGMFAVKVSADGSKLVYSTLLPGPAPIPASRISTDFIPTPHIAAGPQGNAYLTGPSLAEAFFVMKLNPDGTAPLYNITPAAAAPAAIAVDAGGNAYLTGEAGAGLPVTAGAAQATPAGTPAAFVEKLDPSGNVAMATYLGGSSQLNWGTSIQLDSTGNIYVGGATYSFDFPTTAGSYLPQVLLPAWAMTPGGFAAKLSPAGGLLYSTYIIDTSFSFNAAISVIPDPSGGVYVAGVGGPGFPVTVSAPQPCADSQNPAVVTHLGANGNLIDRTYFGQSYLTSPFGLAMPTDHSVELGASASSNSGVAAALAELDFGDGVTPPASCLSSVVLNAASFTPGVDSGTGMPAIAPGSAITLTGFGLGPQAGVSAQPTAEGTLPSDLGGVQVLINGQAAPLLYVQSQQINAFAPFTLTPYTTAKISVAYNGAAIGSTSVTVALQQGAVFRLSDTSTQAVAINQDGTLNGPAHPAPVGSVIAVYGTGFGQTQLPGVSGTLFPDTASSFASIIPAASIDSLPANVEYAGAAPLQWAGIDQINVQIPAGVPSGEASLYIDSWVMSFVTFWVR